MASHMSDHRLWGGVMTSHYDDIPSARSNDTQCENIVQLRKFNVRTVRFGAEAKFDNRRRADLSRLYVIQYIQGGTYFELLYESLETR